ncbi:MAG TPA: GNAT family N-acetyltransferase [Gemmatimonadales bacterium]|nr:GNAT family N-acetyltransferase [Gemmatimonadales bacterium]
MAGADSVIDLRASTAIRIRELAPDAVCGWDQLVRQFSNHRVVHTLAWVRSLTAAGFGRSVFLIFEKDNQIVGCMPGLLSEIGPLRLFGSPPPASQTVSMGPLFHPGLVTTWELMEALVPFLEVELGVHHMEIMSPDLDPASMVELGFRGEPWPTYRVRLYPEDQARCLRGFRESARRNVNRALKLGLQVRFESNESFVDEHYDQIVEVYLRGGHAVNFKRQRVLECFRQLRDSGNLLAVSVTLPDTATVIATGMFTIEGTELLLWTWAHRSEHRWYRPTELMTWRVMQRAMEAGCQTFDLMGLGEFKTKFGAELDNRKYRWVRSRYRWLTGMRDLAAKGLQWQQSFRGRLGRWRERV